MFKTVHYYQWPSDTVFLDKIQAIDKRVRSEYHLRRTRYGFRRWDNSFYISKSRNEHYVCDSHEEFMSVMSTIPFFEVFKWHSTYLRLWRFSSGYFRRRGVGVDFQKARVDVSVYADDLGFIERVHELVRDIVNLNNPERLDEDSYRRKMLDPTVFIARHFDEGGHRCYAKLSDFLYLLGFSVSQGEEYTSDAIPDKVKRRIEQCDIIIVLVTGDRDHSWLISEASYALGRQKHLILMLESDARIESGLLGRDFEYMMFAAGHVEDGYTRLMREFRSTGVKGIFC